MMQAKWWLTLAVVVSVIGGVRAEEPAWVTALRLQQQFRQEFGGFRAEEMTWNLCEGREPEPTGWLRGFVLVKQLWENERKLLGPVNLNYQETPLRDVFESLSSCCGIKIIMHKDDLEAACVDLNTPLSLKVEGVSLTAALTLLLKPAQLTYRVTEEGLVISTRRCQHPDH